MRQQRLLPSALLGSHLPHPSFSAPNHHTTRPSQHCPQAATPKAIQKLCTTATCVGKKTSEQVHVPAELCTRMRSNQFCCDAADVVSAPRIELSPTCETTLSLGTEPQSPHEPPRPSQPTPPRIPTHAPTYPDPRPPRIPTHAPTYPDPRPHVSRPTPPRIPTHAPTNPDPRPHASRIGAKHHPTSTSFVDRRMFGAGGRGERGRDLVRGAGGGGRGTCLVRGTSG